MQFPMVTILLSGSMVWAGPMLEFLEPAPGQEFFRHAEIPLALRGQIPGETITFAEVFVDGRPAGIARYCCTLCPCPPPEEGAEMTLRILANSEPPDPENPWRGIRNVAAGPHTLTAMAFGSGGTLVEAAPVTVTVLLTSRADQILEVAWNPDGRLAFRLPEGSLVPGGFDLWISHDLVQWTRLGSFSPGAVAAFASHTPDPSDPRPQFYRAVRLSGPRP